MRKTESTTTAESDAGIPEAFVVGELESPPALIFLAKHGQSGGVFEPRALKARRLRWRAFVLGRGSAQIEASLRGHRAELASLTERARGAGRAADEARGALAGVEKLIQSDLAVLDAIPQEDRIDYRARAEDAEARLDAITREVIDYQSRRKPVPADVMDRHTAAQDQLLRARGEWAARRARFQTASAEAQKAVLLALDGLAEALGSFADAQVGIIQQAIERGGPVVRSFPERLDPAALAAYRVVYGCAEIGNLNLGRLLAPLGRDLEIVRTAADNNRAVA